MVWSFWVMAMARPGVFLRRISLRVSLFRWVAFIKLSFGIYCLSLVKLRHLAEVKPHPLGCIVCRLIYCHRIFANSHNVIFCLNNRLFHSGFREVRKQTIPGKKTIGQNGRNQRDELATPYPKTATLTSSIPKSERSDLISKFQATSTKLEKIEELRDSVSQKVAIVDE